MSNAQVEENKMQKNIISVKSTTCSVNGKFIDNIVWENSDDKLSESYNNFIAALAAICCNVNDTLGVIAKVENNKVYIATPWKFLELTERMTVCFDEHHVFETGHVFKMTAEVPCVVNGPMHRCESEDEYRHYKTLINNFIKEYKIFCAHPHTDGSAILVAGVVDKETNHFKINCGILHVDVDDHSEIMENPEHECEECGYKCVSALLVKKGDYCLFHDVVIDDENFQFHRK